MVAPNIAISTQKAINKEQIVLPITQVHFSFETVAYSGKNINISPHYREQWSGSQWRSAIGDRLRNLACLTKQPNCSGCNYLHACHYGHVFETKPWDIDHMYKLSNAIPHPYALRLKPGLANSENLTLVLTLFGDLSINWANSFCDAVIRAAQLGIGKKRVKYEVTSIRQTSPDGSSNILWPGINGVQPQSALNHLTTVTEGWKSIAPQGMDQLKIDFLTPLRLVKNGKTISPDNLDFKHLFSNLLRRISSLCAFYGKPLSLHNDDFLYLVNASEKIRLRKFQSATLSEGHRYSIKQKRSIPLNGILGSATFEGHELTQLWPFIWLGQFTQAGKSTTQGLGYYRIRSES